MHRSSGKAAPPPHHRPHDGGRTDDGSAVFSLLHRNFFLFFSFFLSFFWWLMTAKKADDWCVSTRSMTRTGTIRKRKKERKKNLLPVIDHWFSLHLLLLLLHFVCVCVCAFAFLSSLSFAWSNQFHCLAIIELMSERVWWIAGNYIVKQQRERASERARSCTRTGSRPSPSRQSLVIKTFLVIVCAFWFLSSSSCTLATYDVPTSAAALFSAASAAVHKPLKWHPSSSSSSSSSSSILFRFCCNNSNRDDRVRGKKKAPAS